MSVEIVSQDFERFWSRVDQRGVDECWGWQAGKHIRGYGVLRWEGTSQCAHRVAWQLTYGLIPAGKNVLQSCRNPLCCNPAHLFLGAQSPRRKRGHVSQPRPEGTRKQCEPKPLPTALRREVDVLKARVTELEAYIAELKRSITA